MTQHKKNFFVCKIPFCCSQFFGCDYQILDNSRIFSDVNRRKEVSDRWSVTKSSKERWQGHAIFYIEMSSSFCQFNFLKTKILEFDRELIFRRCNNWQNFGARFRTWCEGWVSCTEIVPLNQLLVALVLFRKNTR